MRQIFSAILLAALPGGFFMGDAYGQMVCGSRGAIVDALGERDEARTAAAVSGNGGLVELFTTRDGSTWTLLLTMPGGPTCLFGAGEEWEAIEFEPPKPETRTN